MAKITIDGLINENFEIAFEEPLRLAGSEEENEAPEELPKEKKEEIKDRKLKIVNYFLKGLKLAATIG